MKRIRISVILLFVVIFTSFFSLANAGERLNKEQVRQLLTGNTVEEVFVEKPWQNKIFFTAEGEFRRIDQNGNPDSGKWDFDPDGSLCFERKKRKCYFLEAAEEGVYHLISRRRGQHAKTWSLVKGNPYNL